MIKDKIIKALLLCVVLGVGVSVGKALAIKNGRILDEKKVAIRVELRKDNIDYDLSSMLSYLKCKYEKEGFFVDEFSYAGDLYPKRLDNAGVNIFVRGSAISLDKRVYEKAHNIYLVPRFIGGHKEEFRNFDEYVALQKDLAEAGKQSGIDIVYMEQKACERKELDRSNASKIVYIYERNDEEILKALSLYPNLEVYRTIDFAKFSEKEREDIFKRAKVVVYGVSHDLMKDSRYLGFAIYDILSYGVPVVTNRMNIREDIDNLYYFMRSDDLISQVNRLK